MISADNVNPPDLHFRILEQLITIRCDDELFRNLVLANYEALLAPEGPADLEYTIGRRSPEGFCILRHGETVVEENSDEAIQYMVVYMLEKLITIDLQHRRTDLYFVHSSALERSGGTIMIAADSGTGKSTTSWALLQHGFQYLSDELAPIDPANLNVHPYPHALCLKAAPPAPYQLPERALETERTVHIPVASLPAAAIKRPVPLRALFFLQRDPGVSVPSFATISPAEAGARLYANTLNALAHPGHGLDVAIRIAGAVPAFTLHAGELRATCELISGITEDL